jgi:hypothetical protein
MPVSVNRPPRYGFLLVGRESGQVLFQVETSHTRAGAYTDDWQVQFAPLRRAWLSESTSSSSPHSWRLAIPSSGRRRRADRFRTLPEVFPAQATRPGAVVAGSGGL